MSSNILALPFRRSHDVSLKEAITKYISDKYDQHPQMFAQDMETIDRLRHEAITAVDPHVSGVHKIMVYAAQLTYMTSKFPVDMGIDFVWYPALGYNTHRPATKDNIQFELTNVLFNLAAMYSHLALAANRGTSEGLKAACNYFNRAAGVLAHIKSACIPNLRADPPEDLDNPTLEAIESLMLAQAQECFWQKAVKDGLKDASIAKLAATVSDFYRQASDWGIKSNAVSSEWIHHMNAKHHHFAAAAEYRMACDCLDKRKYGEEVGRLRECLRSVNDAMREARYINRAVQADLDGLKSRAGEDLKRAEKDNDMIYLLPVPSKTELKQIDRATMVAAKVPPEISRPVDSLGDNGVLGRPLFAKLVPYSVHVAASIYTDRRDTLISEKILQKLDALTAQVHELMSSLQLPGSLQALEKPLGLPPALSAHAQEIRQQNGIQRLNRVVADTEKLKFNDRAIFQEGVDILRVEAGEDEAARRRFGTDRWSRKASGQAVPQLYAKVTEIESYFDQASNSDRKLAERLRQNETMIRLLGGTDRDLEDFVPSSRRAPLTSTVEREVINVRSVLNEIHRMEARRKKKVDAVKAKARADDIHAALLVEATRLERENPLRPIEAAQFDDFFNTRLEMYKAERAEVQAEQSQQDDVLDRLRQSTKALSAARGADTSSKEREHALQKLDNAYLAYREIVANLDTGRSFYNDFATIVSRFRDDCRSHVLQRRAEAARLEDDLINALGRVNFQDVVSSSNGGNGGSSARFEPLRAKTDAKGVKVPETPLVAPRPTRTNVKPPEPMTGPQSANSGMWTPDMPIRFGN